MFQKLDSRSREVLDELFQLERISKEWDMDLPSSLDLLCESMKDKEKEEFTECFSFLEKQKLIQVIREDNDSIDEIIILHEGRTYFEQESEYLKNQVKQQVFPTTYNIQNTSQSIIGSQQNATINLQCNSIEELEHLIFEKGGDDKAELFALANETKEILMSIQSNTQLPQKKGFFARLSDHASKHGWFYGAVMQLVGTAFLQMYFK